MARNRIWVLNLDAEDEMANPAFSRSPAMQARIESLIPCVAALLDKGDTVLDGKSGTRFSDAVGRAWSPTPSAVRAWKAAGAVVPAVPSFDIIRRANDRRFCAELGQTLPSALFANTPADVARAIESETASGHWLLKRAFGFAGRGRRRVRCGAIDASVRSWIEASFDSGRGLQVEPWVERSGDFALHGFIAHDGTVCIGTPTVQHTDGHGAWLRTERAVATALSANESQALFDSTAQAAEALSRAGYHGPFGIDAYRWIGAGGEPRFNARSEINARFSMGYAIGMGASRPDLEL